MTNEEISKKLETIEDEIEKLLTSKAFVCFLHLDTEKSIELVWRNAQRAIYQRIGLLNIENKRKVEELIRQHIKYSNQLKLEEWSKLYILEGLFKKFSKAYLYESTFIFSLTIHQLLRWEKAKEEFAAYALRSTIPKNIREYRNAKGLDTPAPDISLIIRDTISLKRDKLGNFDIDATISAEKNNSSLKAQLSAFSYIPQIMEDAYKQLKNISPHPVLYTLYKKTAESALWAGLFHLAYFAGKFSYDQLKRGVKAEEADDNCIEFMKSQPERDPDMKLEIDGKNLWDEIFASLAKDKGLKDIDAKIIAGDIIQLCIFLCKIESATPDLYFELVFRESSDEEKQLESSSYSMDLYTLDELSRRIPDLYETYVITLSNASLLQIFVYATRGKVNPNLYPPLPGKNAVEIIADFIESPWGFIVDPQPNKFMKKENIIEEIYAQNLDLNNNTQ